MEIVGRKLEYVCIREGFWLNRFNRKFFVEGNLGWYDFIWSMGKEEEFSYMLVKCWR